MAQEKNGQVKKEPEYNIRLGNVSASVFGNKQKDKDGKEFMSRSVALSCSYLKDGIRVFKNLTIVRNDLDSAIAVLQAVKSVGLQ